MARCPFQAACTALILRRLSLVMQPLLVCSDAWPVFCQTAYSKILPQLHASHKFKRYQWQAVYIVA